MIPRRIAFATVFLFAFAAPLILAAGAPGAGRAGQPAGAGVADLGFGNWSFTGKDMAGVVWTGTLGIEKLDTSMFDPLKYVAQGNLRIESADGGGKGANPPVQFDPATRVFTMGAESDYGGSVYTAVLSPDGKRLTKGVWKETERGSDEKEKRVVSEGQWSAVRIEK